MCQTGSRIILLAVSPSTACCCCHTADLIVVKNFEFWKKGILQQTTIKSLTGLVYTCTLSGVQLLIYQLPMEYFLHKGLVECYMEFPARQPFDISTEVGKG